MQQLLISVLSDLNNTSPDITASAVISTDGLPIATMLPSHLNADRVGAMSATLLALGNRSVHELACGELDQVMVKGKTGYILLSQAGDNAGVLLRGIERSDIERGQVLCKPGTITPHTEFEAEVYILKKEEGGRHTPFSKGYKPQFYFRTTDVTGEVELPADKEMVMPGDTVTFTVKLQAPIAMEKGLNFAIREGGRTVGAGVVTEVVK